MLVALEGVDCVGKTTLFGELRPLLKAKFVPSLPLPSELWPVMPWVELRQVSLWEHLYDPDQLYVCDRSVFTSAPVYDALMERPLLFDPSKWASEVRVLYLQLGDVGLARRFAERGDAHITAKQMQRLHQLYEEHCLSRFEYYRIDAARPDLVSAAVRVIRGWTRDA